MQQDYWHDLWKKREIGFNQADINRHLLRHHQLLGPLSGKQVFVPLCGKSIDMTWFLQQQASVTGVEISRIGIEEFFSDFALTYEKSQQGSFYVYQHKNLNIFLGDFFQLTRQDIGDIDITYDRASLIALPSDLRKKYAKHLTSILPVHSKIFLITMEYLAPLYNRAPFPIKHQEVFQLYDSHFDIQLIDEHDEQAIPKHLLQRGFHHVVDRIYLLTKTR